MPQFGGAAEKCTVCNKTVYLAEKIVVEDKEDKKTFHKTCLKCTHCKVTLSLGNYASMQGVFYCKPHFKQLFATKGNYDEGFGKDKHSKNWTPQVVASTPGASFIPVDKDESASASKKETPPTVAPKFKGSPSSTEKCLACNKTVYATEKILIEEKDEKKVYHKTCLKCTHCNVIVTLGNYASQNGTVYCKAHFKQLFSAKGSSEEVSVKEKPEKPEKPASKWEPTTTTTTTPTSFVPVEKEEVAKDKKPAPETVTAKFTKGATTAEKCTSCGKTVYLTERIVVEDKENKFVYHKPCLRCSHCQVVLSLGNYASMNGVFFCKPHFKQLFKSKGNYDEGFGREKHSRKWLGGEKEDGGSDGNELSSSAELTSSKGTDAEPLPKDSESETESIHTSHGVSVSDSEDKRREEETIREEEERAAREREEQERKEEQLLDGADDGRLETPAELVAEVGN